MNNVISGIMKGHKKPSASAAQEEHSRGQPESEEK